MKEIIGYEYEILYPNKKKLPFVKLTIENGMGKAVFNLQFFPKLRNIVDFNNFFFKMLNRFNALRGTRERILKKEVYKNEQD